MWLFNWKKTTDFEKSKKWTDHIKEFFTLKKDLGDLGDQVVDVNNKFNDYYKKAEIDKIKRELEDVGRDVGSFYNRINDVEEDMDKLKEKVNTIVEFINQLKDKEFVDKQYLTQNYYSKTDLTNYSVYLRVRELGFAIGPNNEELLNIAIIDTPNQKDVFFNMHNAKSATFYVHNSDNTNIFGKNNHNISQYQGGPWKIT